VRTNDGATGESSPGKLAPVLARARGCDAVIGDSSRLIIARVVGAARGICRERGHPIRAFFLQPTVQAPESEAKGINSLPGSHFWIENEIALRACLRRYGSSPDRVADLKRYDRQTAVLKTCCQSFDRYIIVVVDLDAGSIKSARTVAVSDWQEQGQYR
jgi:hypothetical protein